MTDQLNCSILNCSSHTFGKNVIYFRYPLENKEILKKWLNEIKRPNWHPVKSDVICSRHFKISDINNPSNKHLVSLKSDAIPCIFPKQPQLHTSSGKISPLKTVKSNMIVKKQIDPKSPGSILLVPVNKNQNKIPVVPKTPPVVVSKAKTTGMTLIKPVPATEPVKGKPGRKRKVVDIKTEIKTEIKSEENEKKVIISARKPILRICVNKAYKYAKNGEMKEKMNKEEENKNNIYNVERKEQVVDQIEAQSVIFKLDHKTREIIILKKKKQSYGNSTMEPTVKRIRNGNQLSQKELEKIYTETWKTCHYLQKKLKMLQLKQSKEQKEINRLQSQLLDLQKKSKMQKTKGSSNEQKERSNLTISATMEVSKNCEQSSNIANIKVPISDTSEKVKQTNNQIINNNLTDYE